MNFQWDYDKEQINISKHGIDFDTAIKVFNDDYRIEKFDKKHSDDEDRYITIGMIDDIAVVLMVVYTEREEGTIIRIISARKATNRERKMYYDCDENF